MELQGKIIAVLPERSGESARGAWKTQDFVLETHDAYPKKMVFNVFGAERLERFNIQAGQEVLVSFDIDAHEYQGRWYNTVRAFDVRPAVSALMSTDAPMPAATPGAPAAPSASAAPFPAGTVSDNSSDDLPF